ncbi:hypothetical protein [Terrabacter sp. NPDC000476]|uniref:hypothetical protein n=1 Tax=Terrabacter sp. NPDC000476 TaxID=3154258 RepID=UPI0033176C10
MTDDTTVRELMRGYAGDEPPLRLTVEDVRREAGTGLRDAPGGVTVLPRRSRWRASVPLVAAAACALLAAGGVVLAINRGGAAAPTGVTPAGGGPAQGTLTAPPSISPSPVPTATSSAPSAGPVRGSGMPDLLRSVARSVAGPGLTERAVEAATWTFDQHAQDGVTRVPLGRADEATSWTGSWGFDDGARTLSLTSELKATDVTEAQRRALDPACTSAPATLRTCRQWTLADGSVARETYADFTWLDTASDRRVTHSVTVETQDRVLRASESRLTDHVPADITTGWSVGTSRLQAVLEDDRLRFVAPATLPDLPSMEFCVLPGNTAESGCVPNP